MALDYQVLSNWKVPDAEQTYTERDTMLYALSLGLGSNPIDTRELDFVYEKRLKALPMLALVVGTPGGWFADPRTGITFRKLVNAGVSARFIAPMPPRGSVVGRTTIVAVADKGKERGALLVVRRDLFDSRSNTALCNITTNYLLRGDGGFGGPDVYTPPPHALPDRQPDQSFEYPTLGQAALIYRLNGDLNPLHADPEVARAVGFPSPILHGLATFGMAGWIVLSKLCDADPTRLKLFEGRFSSPFIPGETLVVDVWKDAGQISLRARSRERNVVVLNNGKAEIA